MFNVSEFKYKVQCFSKYKLESPSKPCTFSIGFEREKIYIGGRYCKFSRTVPQSPWTVDLEVPPPEGNSVSEKVGNAMKKFCRATDTRFMSSGRLYIVMVVIFEREHNTKI